MKNSSTLQSIVAAFSFTEGSDEYNVCEILAEIIDRNHKISDFIYECEEGEIDDRQTLLDFIEEFDPSEDDQSVEFDCCEYRIIKDSAIWGIYVEEIENIVTGCYDLKLDKIPDFIAVSIDWEQTARNAYVDGYGHTFASYDGEEICTPGYWAFRVN